MNEEKEIKYIKGACGGCVEVHEVVNKEGKVIARVLDDDFSDIYFYACQVQEGCKLAEFCPRME